jgi:membrane protease YdiL (CAAX protease family)
MLTAILICGIYVAGLLILSKRFGVEYPDITKSTHNIKYGITYPVGIGAVALTVYAFATDQIPDVFSIDRSAQNPLLWLIPAVSIIGIILRFTYSRLNEFDSTGLVYLVVGTFMVGYSEELLVRGVAVHTLLDQGYSVVVAGLVSSVIFGLLHFMNYFNGQDLGKTLIQVVGTMLMGLGFYITFVISGNLWVPITVHFLYDLSILLLGPEPKLTNSIRSQIIALSTFLIYILPIVGLFILS